MQSVDRRRRKVAGEHVETGRLPADPDATRTKKLLRPAAGGDLAWHCTDTRLGHTGPPTEKEGDRT